MLSTMQRGLNILVIVLRAPINMATEKREAVPVRFNTQTYLQDEGC
jgi:hypothetical protein